MKRENNVAGGFTANAEAATTTTRPRAIKGKKASARWADSVARVRKEMEISDKHKRNHDEAKKLKALSLRMG